MDLGVAGSSPVGRPISPLWGEVEKVDSPKHYGHQPDILFGNVNPMKTTKKIINAIEAVPSRFPTGATNKEWTNEVKRAVAEIGEAEGCGIRGLKSYEVGWLYDLCWYISGPDKLLRDVPLVMESERLPNISDIRYDFEKLLIVRSAYKVMVFKAKCANVKKYFDEIGRGIHSYKKSCAGETFILACFDEDLREFIIRGIKVLKQ